MYTIAKTCCNSCHGDISPYFSATKIYAADIFLEKTLGKLSDRDHCTQSLAMLPFGNTFSPLFFHCTQKLHLTQATDSTENRDCVCRNLGKWIAVYMEIWEVWNSHMKSFLLICKLKWSKWLLFWAKYIFTKDTLHDKFQPRISFFMNDYKPFTECFLKRQMEIDP